MIVCRPHEQQVFLMLGHSFITQALKIERKRIENCQSTVRWNQRRLRVWKAGSRERGERGSGGQPAWAGSEAQVLSGEGPSLSDEPSGTWLLFGLGDFIRGLSPFSICFVLVFIMTTPLQLTCYYDLKYRFFSSLLYLEFLSYVTVCRTLTCRRSRSGIWYLCFSMTFGNVGSLLPSSYSEFSNLVDELSGHFFCISNCAFVILYRSSSPVIVSRNLLMPSCVLFVITFSNLYLGRKFLDHYL